MSAFIQVTRHLYEEPYQLNLVIIASNGFSSGSLEFYLNADSLAELGRGLSEMPGHNKATAKFYKKPVFEKGSERPEDNHSWYFRLRAFAVYRGQAAAIQLRMNNNQNFLSYGRRHGENLPLNHQYIQDQLHQLTDFSIITDLNKILSLGEAFTQFSKLKEQRLFWTPKEGSRVDNNVKYINRTAGDVFESAYLSLPENLTSFIPELYKRD